MNANWLQFLQTQGATVEENGAVKTFGHPELERFLVKNGPVLSSQAHQGLIQVSGADAFDFLQNQLTNDLAEVSDEKAQLSAWCDPQGQVLALFVVIKQGEDFYLMLDGSIKDTILKRLQMFILRSKVTLTDLSDEWAQIGYAGEFADLEIQRLLQNKNKELYEVTRCTLETENDIILVKLPGLYHRYQLMGNIDSLKSAWQKLRNQTDPINNHDWQLLDIAAGIPQINQANQGKYIAQFLNLDKLGAINFKKGCFPGQEIIARIHYRGKVTKRMFRLHLSELLELHTQDTLTVQDQAGHTFKFEVVLANPDILHGTLCLAVSTVKPLLSAEGQLKLESGAVVNLEPLPYEVLDEATV
ncbi:CAF17-like 4Fe-4S cluster assembly/insertion protein YgfZ [Galenea microaerophila]